MSNEEIVKAAAKKLSDTAKDYAAAVDGETWTKLCLAAEAYGEARRALKGGTPAGGGAGSDVVFPPYGRSKGQPVKSATMQDLEYYANGCRRTLNDPGKSRWHDKERVLLNTIEREIASR